jgi:aryl-alcohol dehydrogenase-like predicted oxidoreductase
MVSELGLGTWGLSGDAYGEVPEKTQDAVIERALDLGVTLFDTADVYGRGKMESKLGQRLKDDATTVIVTKIGTDLDTKPNRKRFDLPYLKEAFERSQERLRRDKMDVVLLHNPSAAAVAQGEAAAWLQSLVDEGKLKAWGISAGDRDVVNATFALRHQPQIVEMAFNVFISRRVQSLERDLKEKQIALLARSVLSHGLLAGLWPVDKTFAPEDHRSQRWTQDQLRRRIHQLKAVRVLNSGVTTASMRGASISYVLHHEFVASAILGPRSVLQLDQLVRETGKAPPYVDARARQQLQVQLTRFNVE